MQYMFDGCAWLCCAGVEDRLGDMRMVRVREIVQHFIIPACLSFVITGLYGEIRACGEIQR